MATYCGSCKKYTVNKNSNVRKTKQNRLMLLSNCAVCGNKKLTFIRNKELHNFDYFKMNKIINKFLLNGDKFMTDLYLKKPGFTYSACGTFIRYRKRIQKFRETGNLKHFYRNELDKACFAYVAAYSDSKALAKRTVSDKIFKDRPYKIARNCIYDGYQRALASKVDKCFEKKTWLGAIATSKAGISAKWTTSLRIT